MNKQNFTEKAVYLVIMLFWPVSLLLVNTFNNFVLYLIPGLIVALGITLAKFGNSLYLLILMAIPFISPKLSIFPFIFFTLNIFTAKKKAIFLLLSIVSLIVLAINWPLFKGQTIFTPDYQLQQEVIRNTHLYKTSFMARLFHNKAKIVLDKFNSNLFSLIDLNNYFFGFAPRQSINNQNLNKYPMFAIFLFIVGILHQKTTKNKYVLIVIVSLVISLSILNIFDRNDFVLWFPITCITLNGLQQLKTLGEKRYQRLIHYVFLIISTFELIRIILIHFYA
jgi:hypothetical protein